MGRGEITREMIKYFKLKDNEIKYTKICRMQLKYWLKGTV